jgi:hypothetical protein
MAWQERAGDRRERPRFEVIGRLPGTMISGQVLRVLNIGQGGALVEARMALPVGSLHRVKLECVHAQNEVSVIVRRVIHEAERHPPYLIALEFADADDRVSEQIAGLFH